MTTQHDAPSTKGRGGRGARQRILNTAINLFYREGINATGVERLASEASVSKRTLYQHFPSKTAVVEEYLRYIQQGVDDPIRPGPDATDRTPRERILALFATPPPGAQMRGLAGERPRLGGLREHVGHRPASEVAQRTRVGALRERHTIRRAGRGLVA